jgi:gliding motility-associated-like protein
MPKHTSTLAFFACCLLTAQISFAQTIFCPPNLDFEQGNLNNWEFYTGNCCPVNTPTLSGAVAGRHELTMGPLTDPYGGFPVVAPAGGNFSLKLGNNITGSQAERARYYVQIPLAPNKYILIYRYAVVFEDPGHNPAHQPRFDVKVYDSATGQLLPCNDHSYVASANLPNFKKNAMGILYRDWTTASLDLTNFSGKTVAIDFASGDCALGGHFGYGYVDMSCGLFQIYATQCNNTDSIVLKGPPGFAKYIWMDVNFTTVIDTQQIITQPLPPANTIYAVIVKPYQGFGCPDTFYTQYNLMIDHLSAIASPDAGYCKEGPVLLSVGTNNIHAPFKYSWWPAAGLSCTDCPNPKATPLVTTTYHVTIENDLGCKDTDDVVVTLHETEFASVGSDTGVCEGQAVMLNAQGGVQYYWSPGVNLSAINIPNPVATVKNPIKYFVVVKSQHGCHDTETISVEPYPYPIAYAGADTLVCVGGKLNLTGNADSAYHWFPTTGFLDSGKKTPLIRVWDTTQYYLAITNNYGCSDTASVTIYTMPLPVFKAGIDTSICAGDTISVFAEGGDVYWWHDDDAISGKTDSAVSVWPSIPHDYVVTITDTTCDLEEERRVKVDVFPMRQLKVVATPIQCGAEIGQLTAYGGKSYTWTPAEHLTFPNAAVTKAAPKVTTRYMLTGINGYGCRDTAEATLEVHGDDGIFAPGAFTPNSDGLNDCYRLIVTGNILRFEFHIYNRWGQEVFASNDHNACWDGKYKSEKQDMGTYYYFYRASSPLCGDFVRKGDVHLLR